MDAGAFIAISPQAGFPLDPFLVSLQGGGPVDASTVSDGCNGFVAEAPAVTVDYQGEADLLRAFFLSNGDTTLVVQTPDGDFLCNDDTHPLLLDPSIVITAPVQAPTVARNATVAPTPDRRRPTPGRGAGCGGGCRSAGGGRR